MKIAFVLSVLFSSTAFAADSAYLMIRQQGAAVDIGGSDQALVHEALQSAVRNAVEECVQDFNGTPAANVCITDRSAGKLLNSRKSAGVRKAKVSVKLYCRVARETLSSFESWWYERDGTNFSNCIERLPVRELLRK